jgi:hypothetical protein
LLSCGLKRLFRREFFFALESRASFFFCVHAVGMFFLPFSFHLRAEDYTARGAPCQCLFVFLLAKNLLISLPFFDTILVAVVPSQNNNSGINLSLASIAVFCFGKVIHKPQKNCG